MFRQRLRGQDAQADVGQGGRQIGQTHKLGVGAQITHRVARML